MRDGLPRAFDADLSAKTFLYLQGDDRQADKDHPMTPAVPAVLGGSFDIQPVHLPVAAYYPALQDFSIDLALAAVRKQLANAEKEILGKLAERENSAAEGQHWPDIKMLEVKRTVAHLRVKSLVDRQAADRAKFTGADEALTKKRAATAAATERQLNAEQADWVVLQKQ